MVRTHSERGSEVLEAAIVLPMLIVLAFCLIQVCLIAYEGTAMSAAIESAVDYKIPTLISVGSFDGIKMSKTIKVEVPVSEKMEVSR